MTDSMIYPNRNVLNPTYVESPSPNRGASVGGRGPWCMIECNPPLRVLTMHGDYLTHNWYCELPLGHTGHHAAPSVGVRCVWEDATHHGDNGLSISVIERARRIIQER